MLRDPRRPSMQLSTKRHGLALIKSRATASGFPSIEEMRIVGGPRTSRYASFSSAPPVLVCAACPTTLNRVAGPDWRGRLKQAADRISAWRIPGNML